MVWSRKPPFSRWIRLAVKMKAKIAKFWIFPSYASFWILHSWVNFTNLIAIFSSKCPHGDFKPGQKCYRNIQPQYSDNVEFSGSTRNKSHFSELFFFNIFHQDVKFGIFDGKIVMSKFARIFETYKEGVSKTGHWGGVGCLTR